MIIEAPCASGALLRRRIAEIKHEKSGGRELSENGSMRWWPLTREQPRERAREHVEQRGLPWTKPVRVTRRSVGGWRVVTNSDYRGGNIFMEVGRHGRVKGGERVPPR